MKKTLISALCLALNLNSAYADYDPAITTADDITYNWLIRTGELTGYTDHIPHFKFLFEQVPVRAFLEFGVGFSTKYFLDYCDKVISVEFITNGYGPEWFKDCISLYQNYSNWVPIAFFTGFQGDVKWAPYKYIGSDSVYVAASYQCSTHKNYALIDSFYLKELDAFLGRLVKSNNIDVAFVDAGIYLRGDLVQQLFNKVSIILAHDTTTRALGFQDDVYGYSRIVTPDNYEEIFIPDGHGTTAWILNDDPYLTLIDTMKDYANSF